MKKRNNCPFKTEYQFYGLGHAFVANLGSVPRWPDKAPVKGSGVLNRIFMVKATSWISFYCFTQTEKEKKKSGISTNPKAEKQPFRGGGKETPSRAA